MKVALIGYTGFVGKNLMLQRDFSHVYNSKNFTDMVNETFDTIYCCGVSATKWLANKNPDDDWKAIQTLLNVLKTVSCSQFILISTIDVYARSEDENTENKHTGYSNEPYGKHRRQFEEEIEKLFKHVYIVRLPALFGSFLKKNIVYDMLENTQKQTIYLEDSYQFYYIRHLERDIQKTIQDSVRLINLFPEPIKVQTLYDIMTEYYQFPTQLSTHEYISKCRKQYNCASEFYTCSANQVLEQFKDFLDQYVFWKHYFTVMPLCILGTLEENIETCHRYGIHRFEVAPNQIWGTDWHYKQQLSSCIPNDEIVVLHAILYPHQWNIWNDYIQTRTFFDLVKIQCKRHFPNVHHLTMGSPKNRQRQGNFLYEIGIILREYNQLFQNAKIYLNWEINAPSFGTDVFHSLESCKELCDEDRKCTLTLDTGSCIMIESSPIEFWEQFRQRIHHIHYSSFQTRQIPNLYEQHRHFFQTQLKTEYKGWITVEITPKCSIYDYLKTVY